MNGAAVELHVADQGPGFPDGFAAHAFERFSRADSARSRGGFGLGLAIAASIARSHGGDAGVAGPPRWRRRRLALRARSTELVGFHGRFTASS